MENLKWGAFKQQLQVRPELTLQFQYAEDTNGWMPRIISPKLSRRQ
jgi:hypothetical protein